MAEEGQRKKINLGWHMYRKENPTNAPSIHVGALVVGVGSLWPIKMISIYFLFSKTKKWSVVTFQRI